MSDYDNLKKLGGCKPKPPEFRFAHSYSPEALTGCWLWLGRERGSNGYGSIKVNGKAMPAHRYSYSLNVGEIPANLLVLHSCDTPLCVNPNHLFLGTNQDNSNDKVSKNRQAKGGELSIRQNNSARCGELSATSILKDHEVIQILQMQLPQRQIAELFNTTQTTVSNIKLRKTWKHIQT